jgi:predicted RNA methylase
MGTKAAERDIEKSSEAHHGETVTHAYHVILVIPRKIKINIICITAGYLRTR